MYHEISAESKSALQAAACPPFAEDAKSGAPTFIGHGLKSKAGPPALFDRDAKFGNEVIGAAKILGTEPVRTAFRSPWQNGVAEPWVGSCRRDLLDHVIVLNERHLKRLMRAYIRYYHEDRTHLGLAKDTPAGRAVARDSADGSRMQSFARLGGLHHRYAVAA